MQIKTEVVPIPKRRSFIDIIEAVEKLKPGEALKFARAAMGENLPNLRTTISKHFRGNACVHVNSDFVFIWQKERGNGRTA